MSDKKIQFSSEKLKKFKSIIDEEIKIIDEELTKLKKEREIQKQKRANTNVAFNQSSKHFQEQAKNKQLMNRLQSKSRELHSALERIEDKSYGVCERTGELIQEARLKAKPTARFDILKK
ncbi:TraR/DksA family transcriptional regulator [Brumimicrobium mesophilum]|uniref:TraR/DksA family transcriptional regulator n=1 Tax=Brumimicrobium mesophilum TaxID=392717 RepID=UPI000D142A3E|nr:TraR/DksA C4-type zinc finger protein [Brumimicrobium mesophilum]